MSTKEIALHQGVAESALYRHFQSKDQILAAVLEHFSQFDSAVMNTIQSQNMSPKQGVTFLITSYVEYYESYPAITAVLETFHTFLRNPNTEKIGREIYEQRLACIRQLLEAGQQEGEISTFFTSEEMADMIHGHFQWMIIKWRMSGYQFSLKSTVMSTLEKVFKISESC